MIKFIHINDSADFALRCSARFGSPKHRGYRWMALIIIAMLSASRAHATEKYAIREGRACGYCHVSGSPGRVDVAKGQRDPVDLNVRGRYYGTHNYSFNGYVEPKAPEGPPLLFRFVERIALPEAARRMSIADPVGDKQKRLILLSPKADSKDQSILTIKKWSGTKFTTEFETETPGQADQLAVGKFASNGKVVILTSKAVWYWDGKAYVSKISGTSVNLVGVMHDRSDSVELALATGAAGELMAYSVNLSATNYLANGTKLSELPAGQVSYLDMHNTPDGFEKIQAGLSQLSRGGIFGLWSPTVNGKQMLFHVDLDQDVDINNGAADPKAKIVVKSEGWKVGVVDPRNPSLATTFFTPRLAGEIYDIQTEGPYGDGTSALLVLTSEGQDKKGRSLYYFAYNTRK